jgi:hypothetical protein
LTQEGRQRDKALSEDEADAASSSWLNGKKVSHDVVAWRRWPEERRHRGGETEETTPVGMTQILLGQKMKKINVVNSATTNGQ